MIYAIDVDGVIIDSQVEQLIDGYNAYRQFYKKTALFDGKRIDFDNYKRLLKKHKDTVNKFKRIHPYAKSAEEIVILYHIIDNNIKIKNDQDFRNLLKTISQRSLMKGHYELYRQRYLFEKHKNWQKIIKPFKEMLNFVKKNITRSVILSNKDLKTIQLMFKYFGIKIDDNRIFSTEITNDKNKKLKLIAKKYKTPYADINFIDDEYFNLFEAKQLGVKCYMAAWGNNNPQQRKEAKKIGIRLLKLENLKNI